MDFQEEVFRSIYMHNLPMVRNIARRFLIPLNDIDDLTQNVFYAYYRVYGNSKPDEEARKLLAKITNRCCLDYWRREYSHPEYSCDPAVIQGEMFLDFGCGPDNLSILLRKQEYRTVADALCSLKKDAQAVMRLCVIEERPTSEVAEILGIREETCRMRLSRAREEMRRKCNRPPKAAEASKNSLPGELNPQKA